MSNVEGTALPPETVRLRDGTPVIVRPIRPDDAPLLQALHARLSAESVFLRFLEQRKALTDQDAQRLATVDYRATMALVATREENGAEEIIGVARYAAVDPGRPERAEAAIVVEDAFQGRGLGTILVDRLVRYARNHGVQAFVASVHYSNSEIMHFIQRSGLPAEKHLESGVWEITIHLAG